MFEMYASCRLCPRRCGVNRNKTTGFCGVTSVLRLSSVVLHKGEEPPISGTNGSGTFFFSGCTLGCSFCQNHQISTAILGKDISQKTFASLLLKVQESGGHNVNFVTGTQFIPGIVQGLQLAKKNGFQLPVVWNSSGFELPEMVSLLSDYVDIFLPDLKMINPEIAATVFGNSLYTDAISKALPGMIKRQQEQDGLLKQGTVVRHLVLPGLLENTREVLKYFARYKDKALFSLMVQYCPPDHGRLLPSLPDQMKNQDYCMSEDEYNTIFDWFDEYGIEEGFMQDLEKQRFWLPDFKKYNPFPAEYSTVLWSAQQF